MLLLRGTYSTLFNASAASQFGQTSWTYQVQLASAPSVNFMAQGSAPTTNCPGSTASPSAAKGQLCVYEVNFTNRTFVCIYAPGPNVCSASDVFGAGIEITSVAAGLTFSFGTWAVTAP